MAQYQLNCSVAVRIPPGKSLTFEMRLDVPATMALGRTSLTWSLSDPRIYYGFAMTAIEIV